MHVQHLNCGVMRPFGGRLLDGSGSVFRTSTSICHCLLIETDAGLVLVETGFGTNAVTRPKEWLPAWFRTVSRPVLDENRSAIAQLAELGYRADDVRHIVLTHLDLDHAGGIADFPKAAIHVSATEHRHLGDARYRAAQFAHGPQWVTYETEGGDDWFGFAGARSLTGLPEDIQLIPLPGHTAGHSGVAVRLDADRWLLHAGDSYFFHGQLAPAPHMPLGYRLFEKAVCDVPAARRDTQRSLRELVATHGDRVDVISAHDPVELDRYTNAAEVL